MASPTTEEAGDEMILNIADLQAAATKKLGKVYGGASAQLFQTQCPEIPVYSYPSPDVDN